MSAPTVPAAAPLPVETEQTDPALLRVWVDAQTPPEVSALFMGSPGFETSTAASEADALLTVLPSNEGVEIAGRVFALTAAFPTIVDELALDEVKEIWRGTSSGGETVIFTTEEGLNAFSQMWGEADPSSVRPVDGQEEMISTLWETDGSLGLAPFESLDPRLKVLAVDGMNPLDKGLNSEAYPLVVRYGLLENPGAARSAQVTWPQPPVITNRDENRLTSVLLTGTTALSRSTAFVMEEKGITYPARDIREWLTSADITHISNEVPLFAGCPPAVPLREEARFCSDPRYIELLEYSGVDVIELTGNHLLDWGPEAFLDTLALYDEKGYAYYGGGINPQAGREPLLLEESGNKIAFLGCNAVGPQQVWATDTQPGPAECNLDEMEREIRRLKDEGYVVIATFQHFELDEYKPQSSQRIDFQRAARAGADIVSGSQAHSPQSMTLIGRHFIHYGLGNLFFDQMFAGYDREFLDLHIIYDGRYISTRLYTARLEDAARPRPMTAEERSDLLSTVFDAADWSFYAEK
ncbi:MAG: CapA family protein [Chloroflexi bacterium]|nr:CapA family protein [Chloroflexota bacterium]